MKISELSARTGLPVGTLKFYLREGVVPPGRRTSRTAAEYDDSHVERVLLVRALTDAGGLGIAAVQRILSVIDAPEPAARLDVLATAQDALLSEGPTATDLSGAGTTGTGTGTGAAAGTGADAAEATDPVGRARTWAEARGWSTFPEDLALARLDRAWQACEQAGVEADEELLHRYADAMEQVAAVDVGAVPEGAADAVRRVIVGTVMLEPVLAALRLMAQREVSMRDAGSRSAVAPGRAIPAEGE